MEIKIKTLNETRSSRVELKFKSDATGEHVIELSRMNAEVQLNPRERLYTAAEVGDAAELIATPLKQRITALENRVDREMDRVVTVTIERNRFQEEAVAARQTLEVWANEVDVLKSRIERAEREVEYHREIADQSREWAERAETRLVKDGVKLAEAQRALCNYFPGHKVSDDIAPCIAELIERIKLLQRQISDFETLSDQCESELHNARVNIESRDRRLSKATATLRRISQEVTADHGVPGGPVANMSDVIDNVRDLVSPWADTSQA